MSDWKKIIIAGLIVAVFPLALGFIIGRAWVIHEAPRFQTSQHSVITPMLALADLKAGEVFADLGCGDGRIVIEAVKKYQVKGVCVEIREDLLMDARANARLAGVSDRVRFIAGDLMDTDFQSIDAVSMFLSPSLNDRVAPLLRQQMQKGSRVVSLSHDITGWPATETLVFQDGKRDWTVRKWLIE